MAIIAHHAHLFPKELNYISPTSGSNATLADLIRYMDTLKIAESVAFAPYPQLLDGFKMDSNEWLSEAIQNEPRIKGFGIIDFRKSIAAIRAQVEKISNINLVGIKIHPAVQQINILGEKAFAAYSIAEKLGLPISFHTGVHWYRMKHDNPLLYDEVAYNFPNLVFSLEHIGGYNFFHEATAVIMNNLIGGDERKDSNIYAGLASCFTKSPRCIFWYIGIDGFKELITLIGDDYILFGLDFPHRTIQELKEQIVIIKDNSSNKKSAEKILEKNLKAFINKGRTKID